MSHEVVFERSFFTLLDEEDGRVTAQARAAGCPACGGRLHSARYPRQPRGGDVGEAGEALRWRRSLCCAEEGCRKRLTPPSLVFLGRRVYLAVTVVMAAWRSSLMAMRSPPRSTVRRWIVWFATRAPATRWFEEVRPRLSPPLEPSERLPEALFARVLPGRRVAAAMVDVLRLMAPLSRPAASG